jgi:hypothetical protein
VCQDQGCPFSLHFIYIYIYSEYQVAFFLFSLDLKSSIVEEDQTAVFVPNAVSEKDFSNIRPPQFFLFPEGNGSLGTLSIVAVISYYIKHI